MIANGTTADNRTRALLPFRVVKDRGAPFVEFECEIAVPRSYKRMMPFAIQAGTPVIEPILRLMEMFCEMEDRLTPALKRIEELTGELAAAQVENHRLEKSISEVKRQNEALRRGGKG